MDLVFFTFEDIFKNKNVFVINEFSKFNAVCINRVNENKFIISGEIISKDDVYSGDLNIELESEGKVECATDIWRLKWKSYELINKGVIKYNTKNHLRNLIPKY